MVRKEMKENLWPDMAKPSTPSYNYDDKAPQHHPNGHTNLKLKHKKHQASKKHKHSLVQAEPETDPEKMHWSDGNGSGGEYADAYWHIGHSSKTNEEFNNRSRQPWIKSANENHSEPTYHNNGYHNA